MNVITEDINILNHQIDKLDQIFNIKETTKEIMDQQEQIIRDIIKRLKHRLKSQKNDKTKISKLKRDFQKIVEKYHLTVTKQRTFALDVIDQHQEDQLEQSLIQNFDIENQKDKVNELTNLEKDLVDLSNVFQDMSILIQNQQPILDDIESNVNSTSYKVEAGVKELTVAKKYQNSCRKKMCYLVFFLTIVIFILVVVLTHGFKK
jgi:hypothetical protein